MTKLLYIFIVFWGICFSGCLSNKAVACNSGSKSIQKESAFKVPNDHLSNETQLICESVEENTDDDSVDSEKEEYTPLKTISHKYSTFLKDISTIALKPDLHQKTPLFVFIAVFRI